MVIVSKMDSFKIKKAGEKEREREREFSTIRQLLNIKDYLMNSTSIGNKLKEHNISNTDNRREKVSITVR